MTESDLGDELAGSIAADYQILRDLASSSGISAFEARAARDGRPVEIKAVPVQMLGSQGAPSDAILASRRVQHPNILPVIESGVRGEAFFWISPAIDATSLRARLARGIRMQLKDSLTVLRDVSAALTHAHLHGVVHGGLSPDNVLISGGSGVVADLGVPEVFSAIRRQVAPDAARSAAAEALRYAAPEQAAGGNPDARSDVYAWGVIAYELLGGRHPFAGRTTPSQMLAAHVDEEPPQLLSGPSNVPASVTKLVMRCLSKDPAKRPESARRLFDVLTRELLVPPPQPAAGSGQKAVVALFIVAVAIIALIAWLGMRS